MNVEKLDLNALKDLYDAYVRLPLRSTQRMLKHRAYTDLLNALGGKYHTDTYQLRSLAGIDY